MDSTSAHNANASGAIAAPLTVNVSGPDAASRHAAMADVIVSGTTEEEAFFLTDLGDVCRKHKRWQAHLPMVEPFYAVKCNSDPAILGTLAALGANFDCASLGEIQAILNLGVSSDRVIFANPCKAIAHLRFAKQVGVRMMTFDNEFELLKIAKHYPGAALVLRVLADDSRSACRLGLKFGADPAVTGHLLQLARQLGLDVVGVSFHVGSGATDARAFADAVARARAVFDEAAALGFSPHLLDVGGGFPGDDPAATPAAAVRFEDIARELRSAFAEHFPPSAVPGLRIIAEPGRYYVASASSLAVCITSKRRVVDVTATTPTATTGATPTTPASNAAPTPATEPPPKFMYYVNDGVYQSFNCIIFDHARVQAQVLYTGNGVPAMDDEHLAAAVLHESSVWGPTCDSIDCVQASTMLPELDVGDWLVFDNMGAYTSCAASTFNGFALTKHVYTFSHVLVDLQRVPAADGIAHVPAALPLAAGFAVAPSAATTPAVTATLGAATAAIARAPKPVGHAVPIPTPVS